MNRDAHPFGKCLSLPASRFGSYRDLELGTVFDRPSRAGGVELDLPVEKQTASEDRAAEPVPVRADGDQ